MCNYAQLKRKTFKNNSTERPKLGTSGVKDTAKSNKD